MELRVLDPFGDYETAGYLRNAFGEKDLARVGQIETANYEQEVLPALRYLASQPTLRYDHVLEVHRTIFSSLYPWAGEDRSINAPHIAIAKAGYKTLFAHPADVRRAAEYALQQAQDKPYLRAHPGEVFGQLAYAHPFLEGNGRTILTVYADLTRRANFHIAWDQIDKDLFLKTLTGELLNPGKGTMDALVRRYVQDGTRPVDTTALNLRTNFKRR
jgi:cell filamentation protein